jgi:hypothetical protein
LTHKSSGKKTDISQALNYLNQVCKKKSLCFLISDFEAHDFETNLKITSRKHDLTCVVTEDLVEKELPDCGVVEFQDIETGEIISLDTSHKFTREALKTQSKQDQDELQFMFRKNKIRHFYIDTRESTVKPLVSYIRQRERA